MMMVPVTIGKSDIHGLGVFAIDPIRKGSVVWQYEPGIDRPISEYSIKYGEQRIADFVRTRGYVNSRNPKVWILPGDEAQFWNFPPRGKLANTELGGTLDGEHIILAARDIAANEELTIPPESDLDWERKMEGR